VAPVGAALVARPGPDEIEKDAGADGEGLPDDEHATATRASTPARASRARSGGIRRYATGRLR